MTTTLTKDLKSLATPTTTVVTQYPATTSVSTAPAKLTDVKYAYFSDSLYGGLRFDYTIQSPNSNGSSTSFDEFGNEITGYCLTFYTKNSLGITPKSRQILITDVIAPHPITTTYPAYSVTTVVPSTTTQVIDYGWNASAISREFFNVDGEVSFSIKASSIGVVAGINNADTSAGSAYEAIKFGIKSSQGKYQVVESGVTKTALTAFTNTSVFKIKISFGVVTYYVDNVLIYTSLATPDYLTSVLDVSFYASGDAIIDPIITQTYSAIATGSASLYLGGYEIDDVVYSSALATATATMTMDMSLLATTTSALSALFYEIDNVVYSTATATVSSTLSVSDYDDGSGVVVESAYLSGYSSLSLSYYEIDNVVYGNATATSFATLSALVYETDNTVYAGLGEATANATAELSLSVYEIDNTVYATAYVSSLATVTALSYEINDTAYLFGVQTMTSTARMAALLVGGAEGRLTLGTPQVRGIIFEDERTVGRLTLGSPQISGYGGATGKLTLGTPKINGFVLNYNTAKARLTLGSPKISGVIRQENTAIGRLSLGSIKVSGYSGATGRLTLGTPKVSGFVIQENSIIGRLKLSTPAIKGYGGATARLTLGTPKLSGYIATGSIATGRLKLGSIGITGLIVPFATLANGITYCINTTNAALTRYTNFNFKKVIRFNNKYYGVKADGLYLLEGVTDNGTAIDSRFQTYSFNFDSRYLKGVECVYLEQNKDVLNVKVTVENNEVLTDYSYQSAFRGKRVKFGRGLTGIYWEFEFSNVSGGAFNLGATEFLVHEKGRKI